MALTAREQALVAALEAFASFADPRRAAPPGLPITQGSGMARRQLTMGDCYRAADAGRSGEGGKRRARTAPRTSIGRGGSLMACHHVSVPGGGVAIVCGSRRRQRCACGRPAGLLCDWKVPQKRSGTCDRPICTACALSPAPGKDLCAAHAKAFDAWRADRAAAAGPVDGVLI